MENNFKRNTAGVKSTKLNTLTHYTFLQGGHSSALSFLFAEQKGETEQPQGTMSVGSCKSAALEE